MQFTSFGEILMRIENAQVRPGFPSGPLVSHFCGAEANVAANLVGLGHRAAFVSCLPSNPLGHSAKCDLRFHGVDTHYIANSAGRMGLLFLEPGASVRASRITYDRAGSALALCPPGQFDWEPILEQQDWLITSGITAALGEGPLMAMREAMEMARKKGVRIAFDCNYRPTLWQGRENDAPVILRELSEGADLLFAGRRAIGLITGESFSGGDANDDFELAAKAAFSMSQSLQHVAATRREVLSAEHNRMTALIASRNELAISQTVDIDSIVDRVGTGDAFAAGVLHGLAEDYSMAQTSEFALACSQWAHSVAGDYMQASLSDIEHLQSNTGDVRR